MTALSAVLACTACENAFSVEAGSDVACGPGTALQIHGGLEPEVAWSPGCRASAVNLEAAAHGIRWELSAPGNLLLPPVRYGAPPAHAHETRVPVGPLLPGVTYTVTLQRDRGATARDTIASATYTP
ncbi:MAG TPA: hypothetical protein VK936_06475 [Longimicrobiales bacterium]|nr:hypothetical protein [Longimicrobiales bacterium]